MTLPDSEAICVVPPPPPLEPPQPPSPTATHPKPTIQTERIMTRFLNS